MPSTPRLLKRLLLLLLPLTVVAASLFGSDSSLLRGASSDRAVAKDGTEPSPLHRLLEAFTFPGAGDPTTTNASPTRGQSNSFISTTTNGCGAPFSCSNGGFCTTWNSDGVNTCTCDANGGGSSCTQAGVECGQGGQPPCPAPKCLDNDSCVPSGRDDKLEIPATPSPMVPATPQPTEKPTPSPRTQHPEIGEGTPGVPIVEQVADLLLQGADQVAPLLGPNSTYKVQDLVTALTISHDWETSASHKKSLGIVDRRVRNLQDTSLSMNLGGELTGQGNLKVAMAHLAVLLGSAWHSGLQYGMCDEPNHNATDENHPGCGQNGLNYRYPFDGFLEEGFGCFANDQEWLKGTPMGCAVQPPVQFILSDAKEESRQMMCGTQVDSIASRDCCWWGRGMLLMTHQCDYGDYQAHWGVKATGEGIATDLCANPGQVCSDEFPELKFLTGLYLWVRDVVHAEDPTFNFMQELEAWVESKMDMRENGNFVDRVGGVLMYGTPDLMPPDYRERRHTVEAALDTLMSLAPVSDTLTYGNVALCKPAVQSSVMEDEVASHAVDGHIDSPNISHTMCEENPWWHVDLETPHQIYTIAIVNRQDCCFERLDHVKIELFDGDGNPIEKNNTVQQDPNMEGHIVNVWTVDFETPVIASQVRVSVEAPPGQCDYLNMAEVQIFGYCQFGDACLTGRPCGLENVAQCKPTSQSSTASDASVSFVAVDSEAANTEEELMAGVGVHVAMTQCEQSPSWEVDLQSRHNISMVAVFIPGDSSPMNGLIVELIDGETGDVVMVKQHEVSTGAIGNIAVFQMENDKVEYLASIVRLRLSTVEGGGCATLSLAEVQVFSDCWDGASCVTWPSCAYENVAQCKAATQSSTFEGGVAWKAIDGHQALAHTKCEEEPWWEVDLLGDYSVTEVILYNRDDCCFDRLNGVVIELKDVLGDTVQSVQHDPEKEGVIEDTWSVNFHGAIARRVRVMVQHEPDSCGYLNIKDIQVMRTCLPGEDCHSWSGCETGNVAQCKPATQSSTFFGDVAAQGVDGDESLAHTDCELNPWWGVNLLEPREVSHVVVHNREDCCYERLNGLKVQLLDPEGKPLAMIQHSLELEGLINTMWIATFDPPIANVNSVFVSTEHPEGFCEFLNLAEVEVMSACMEGDSCMTGFGCDMGNVAMCKPARQSSTMTSRGDGEIIEAGVAGRAVDGHDYLSHTECELAPWWEVNLIGMREVSEVIVHNRQDNYFERLNGILVQLFDDAGNEVAKAQHDPNTEGMIQFSWMKKFDEIPASRVRISNVFGPTCDYLNLADVEVISKCLEEDACFSIQDCVHGNVAQCKPARQISTKEGYVASNAINGTETRLSHTECEENPWWEVDLLGEYPISEVILFNRIDCCQERLNGALVELLDYDGTVVASMQHKTSDDGVIEDKWSADFNQIDFFTASKVRVSVFHPPGTCGYLNLADVQVMSICREGDACLKGESCQDGNVAQCKMSEQSSTRNGAVAIKATDGEESLSMTECESDPWWMVDLETRRDVSEVVLFSRRDCCFEQLNGVLVELMDSFGNLLISAQHNVLEEGPINSVWSAKFAEENVRYVKVSTHHTNGTCAPLDLAEVQVMSPCEDTDACKTGRDCKHENLELPMEDKE